MTTDALQSQLFILKILSLSMASRLNMDPEDADKSSWHASKGKSLSIHTDPSQSSSTTLHTAKFRQPSSEFSFTRIESVSLGAKCAEYILSVMVLYLRQTAPPESRLM